MTKTTKDQPKEYPWCEFCGDVIMGKPYRFTPDSEDYCSRECGKKHARDYIETERDKYAMKYEL